MLGIGERYCPVGSAALFFGRTRQGCGVSAPVRACLLIGLFLTLAHPAGASTAHIEGRVVDAEDGTTLVGAAVVVKGTMLGTVTDLDGRFAFARVPDGTVTVVASLIGYRPEAETVTLATGDTARLVIRLEATVIQGAPLVVTANRRLQELRQSPTAMDILSPAQITGRNAGTPLVALVYVPGTTVIGGQVSIRGSSGFTKGAGSRVGVLVDGISVLSGDAGDVKWELVPPEVIERIEIAKGASSALYGSGALGGVINQITRKPGRQPETRLRVVTGFYAKPPGYVSPPGGEYHVMAAVTHTQQIGATRMLANIRRDADDGARAGGDNTRYNLFLKLDRPWGADGEYGFMGIYSHENHGNALQSYPDSLHYTRANASRIIGPDEFASFWMKRVHGPRFSWRLTTHYYRSKFDEVSGSHETVSFSDAVTGGVEAQAIWMPQSSVTLTVGAAAQNSWINAELFQGKRITDLGAFGQAEVRPVTFATLTAGVHYDRRSSDLSPANGQASPRLGVVITPGATTTLRAMLSKGFRGPTISELSTYRDEGDLAIRPNHTLKPERSWTGEVGFSRTVGTHVSLDFSAFENRYEDMIEPTIQDTTDPGSGNLVVTFDNALKARIRGFEAASQIALFHDHVRFGGSYMFLDTRNRSAETNRAAGPDSARLPYRPRHSIHVGAELRHGRYFAAYDYRYISAYPVTVYPNDPRVPQIVSDARIGVRWRSVRLVLSVTNLFNYIYAPRERKLSDPRRYALSLDAKLPSVSRR